MTRATRVLAVVALVFGASSAAACSSNDDKVPYKDSRSVGAIVLYDKDGKEQTSGKVTDKPFVAKAVSQVKAPAPYDKEGRKATLLAFQPRENIDPATWNGTFLTGANAYSDASHPTVVAPTEALSLKQYLTQYPTVWSGLVQLRMFLGAPGETTLNNSYVTADLKVSGDTWKLLKASDKKAMALAAMAVPENAPTTAGVPLTVTVGESPTPSPSPSASASPSASVSTSPSGGNGGALPRTGSDIAAMAGAGVFLLVTGTVAVVVGRRRQVSTGGSL